MPHRLLLAVLLGPLLTAAAPPSPVPPASPPTVVATVGTGAHPRWAPPLTGPLQVTRAFAAPDGPYGPGHRGVDLAGEPGAAVLAAGPGTVVFAGLVAGRPVVSVEHASGLRTTYEPVQRGVAAGQAVARGSPLGMLLAGHPGCPAAACLHWGLRRGAGASEAYLDPLLLLDPPRIRLLPVP